MNMGLADIEGIGPVFARKLAKAGIRGTGGLLTKGATPKGRKELAAKSGIGGKLILEWVNLADLYRIKGVGSEYSDLLEEAGVDTVVELAKRDAKKLYEKMLAINAKKNLVNQMPGRKQVTKWVGQAKRLPRIVKY
jgi:predicted flap endonuclease-1-like 5' DNA nuclease